MTVCESLIDQLGFRCLIFFLSTYDFTAKTPIKSTFSGGKLSLYVELSSIG